MQAQVEHLAIVQAPLSHPHVQAGDPLLEREVLREAPLLSEGRILQVTQQVKGRLLLRERQISVVIAGPHAHKVRFA